MKTTGDELALAAFSQIPYFEAITSDGTRIDLWSFKQRKNLLILLGDSEPELAGTLAGLCARSGAWRWYETELLVASDASALRPDDCPQAIFLTDPDSSIRNRLRGGSKGAKLLLADKFGALYHTWTAAPGEIIDPDDVEKTVQLMQSECPECGDKCWLDQL